MYEKGNKYLADWRNRKGERRRKSFDTAEAAQAHEDAQKLQARPKQQRGGRVSLPPSRSGSAGRTTTTTKGASAASSSSSRAATPARKTLRTATPRYSTSGSKRWRVPTASKPVSRPRGRS